MVKDSCFPYLCCLCPNRLFNHYLSYYSVAFFFPRANRSGGIISNNLTIGCGFPQYILLGNFFLYILLKIFQKERAELLPLSCPLSPRLLNFLKVSHFSLKPVNGVFQEMSFFFSPLHYIFFHK